MMSCGYGQFRRHAYWLGSGFVTRTGRFFGPGEVQARAALDAR